MFRGHFQTAAIFKVKVKSLSRVRLFASQVLLSVGILQARILEWFAISFSRSTIILQGVGNLLLVWDSSLGCNFVKVTPGAEASYPGGTVDKNPPANGGDMGLIPGPGRFHMPWSN